MSDRHHATASDNRNGGYTLREGLTRLAAQSLGLDPDLAAAVGDDARAALNLLRRARDASDPGQRAELIDAAAYELRGVDSQRHSRFLAQVDQFAEELAGMNRASVNPATGAQEFALWHGLKRMFGADSQSGQEPSTNGIDPINISGRRSTVQLKPLIDPMSITGQPRLETLTFGKAPVMYRRAEREKSINSDSPGVFVVAHNPNATDARPWYSQDSVGTSNVMQNEKAIVDAANKSKLDPDLLRAVMYVETAQGGYGGASHIAEALGLAKTILPMNINPTIWRELGLQDKNTAGNPEANVAAAAELLRRISERLPSPTTEKVATLYNNMSADEVNNYGARVAMIQKARPWAGRVPPVLPYASWSNGP